MGTHLRKLMARNNGMTLVEVIVALLLFSIVFLILLYGINGALKVMGNAQAINNATQSNASKLESLGSSLKAEGATLTDLGDKLTIDGKAIAGTFKVATTKKSNDQTDLSLTLFQPGTLRNTPPLPSVMPAPVPSDDKIVVVPSKGSNPGDAYYSPDEDNNSFFEIQGGVNRGQLKALSDAFNTHGWYINHYGTLNKGVTKTLIESTYPFDNAKNQYLQQLYFINDTPFSFTTLDGRLSYCFDFVYFGDLNSSSECTNIKMKVNYAYGDNQFQTPLSNSTSKLAFNGFTEGKEVILYFSKKIRIDIERYSNWKQESTLEPVYLEKGFYKLPSGTDILKAAYDPAEYTKYQTMKSEGGYKTNYSDIAAELEKLGVVVR